MIPANINSLLLSADAAAPTGYQISRSLRFNSADSAYLNRTPASAGNRKTWTFSCWVKRSSLGVQQDIFTAGPRSSSGNATGLVYLEFETTNQLILIAWTGSSSNVKIQTTALFRDTAAWYHIVAVMDTSNATSTDRMRLYVNGDRVTTFSSATYPAQNTDFAVNNTEIHEIGRYVWGQSLYLSAMLADVYLIDGQALTANSFGQTDATTGVWVPKAFSGGSYGTNGFRLPFSDNSAATATTLGKDAAGSNNWTPNNLSVTAGAGNDSLVDSPTNYGTDAAMGGEVRGNYCTWNPLQQPGTAGTLSNGNLDMANSYRFGTIAVSSGKWYWEVTALNMDLVLNSADGLAGIQRVVQTVGTYPGQTSDSYAYLNRNGRKVNNATETTYGATWVTGDVIGVAFDADNWTLTFYKNGVSQGQAFSSITQGSYWPTAQVSGSGSHATNFGQRPFAYTAPSGFKALNTANLPAPLVTKPSTVMDVALWTGNGTSSARTISGLGFSPDLVWGKSRTNAVSHALADTVRGAGLQLYSNLTAQEILNEQLGYVSAFNSDGFTTTPGSTNNSLWNTTNAAMVAWAWDAGSSTVTNTSGSISSQVRANASAGFSIVTVTTPSSGASTVGHGLGVAPSLIITKFRSTANNWFTYHASIGNTAYLSLDTTAASSTSLNLWNNTSPTSSVFSLSSVWATSNQLVAYCFAPVAGYSSFGSITSNGTSDNAFAYLGFRPRFLLYKNASATGNWGMYDSSRDPENVCDNLLLASSPNAEFTSVEFDFLSNGIKLRYPYTNGNQIVFAAFAESPFNYSRAR